jgi:hypothetical protein
LTQTAHEGVRSYLEAREGGEAEAALTELLQAQAAPVVRRVLRPRARLLGDDFDDLVSQALVQVLSRLRALKANGAGVIGDFEGYVAATAYRAYVDHVRRRWPQRHLFKRKLRRSLRCDSRFYVRRGGAGAASCGLTDWPPPDGCAAIHRAGLTEADIAAFAGALALLDREPAAAADRLHAAFVRRGSPLDLDDLVTVGAGSWRESRPSSARLEQAADRRIDAEGQFQARIFLGQLWREAMLLPLPQRRALLLNLRGGEGRDLLGVLPVAGTASIREIAAALDMPAPELAGLWNRLPLDDLTIAGRLGLTRQQVINLRCAARRRLARRLKL